MAVSWVLKPQHRARIKFQRFMPWWNAQKRKEIADKKEKEAQEKLKEDERLKNEEIEEQNDSTEEKSVNDENTDTCMSQEKSTKSGVGESGNSNGNVTPVSTVEGREANITLGRDRVIEDKGSKTDNINIGDDINTNDIRNDSFKNTKKLPLNDKDSAFVFFQPECVNLNT